MFSIVMSPDDPIILVVVSDSAPDGASGHHSSTYIYIDIFIETLNRAPNMVCPFVFLYICIAYIVCMYKYLVVLYIALPAFLLLVLWTNH